MDQIQYQQTGRIAVLTINRPQSHNALNWQAQERFAAHIETAGQDAALRVLIITAAGSQTFASGGDLKELSNYTDQPSGERLNQIMGQALTRLTELPIPVIAAVNGDAIGGGCEIMTACDLRMASANARFRFAQIQMGLTTGWGGAARFVHLVGRSRAMELLLTGRTFEAAEAAEMGFIHRLVPHGESVLEVAHGWADLLIKLPQEALAATKQLVHAAGWMTPADASHLEGQLFTRLWAKPDHLEALAAFVEKRERS